MVLGRRHRFPQSFAALEVTHQDAQAVQVRVLRCEDLKNGLSNDHTRNQISVNVKTVDQSIHKSEAYIRADNKTHRQFVASWN